MDVRVPKPLVNVFRSIASQYSADVNGTPAPRFGEVNLSNKQLEQLGKIFGQMYRQDIGAEGEDGRALENRGKALLNRTNDLIDGNFIHTQGEPAEAKRVLGAAFAKESPKPPPPSNKPSGITR
jgi:hypothetical protein